MGFSDADEEKSRKYVGGKFFVAAIIGGALLSIISGILLSFQYYAPLIWFKMNEKFQGVEMWTLSGFIGGLLIIMMAILVQLLLIGKTQIINGSEDDIINRKDDFQTPGPQGSIPLEQEIQAIQPPQESIISHLQ